MSSHLPALISDCIFDCTSRSESGCRVSKLKCKYFVFSVQTIKEGRKKKKNTQVSCAFPSRGLHMAALWDENFCFHHQRSLPARRMEEGTWAAMRVKSCTAKHTCYVMRIPSHTSLLKQQQKKKKKRAPVEPFWLP